MVAVDLQCYISSYKSRSIWSIFYFEIVHFHPLLLAGWALRSNPNSNPTYRYGAEIQPESGIKILKDFSMLVMSAFHYYEPPCILSPSLGGPRRHCCSGPGCQAWRPAGQQCSWERHWDTSGQTLCSHLVPCGSSHLPMLPHYHPSGSYGELQPLQCIISAVSWHVYRLCLIIRCY